jgi:ArsR family transcriptional regulator
LKILEEAGLVVSSKDGLWVNYAPSDGSSSPFAASLLGNLRHWLEDNPDIRRAVDQLPFVNREDLCRRS